jgi:hypothetical protein
MSEYENRKTKFGRFAFEKHEITPEKILPE